MKSCLLVGSVGGPNFGDEAIMSIWAKNYQDAADYDIIFCDGFNKENLKKSINALGLKNVYVSSLYQNIHSTMEFFEIKGEKIILNKNNTKSYENRIKNISKNLSEFNVKSIHLIGGGYLNSKWVHNYTLLITSIFVAYSSNIPIFISGQGLLPCNSNFSDIINLLSHFLYCDVRDRESYDFLSSLSPKQKISYSGDDALLAFEGEENRFLKQEDKPSLVFCLQNDLFNGTSFIKNILSKEFISCFREFGINSIKFISAMENDYLSAKGIDHEKLTSMGMDINYTNEYDLLRYGIPFHKDSFYITSRYHIHFFASLGGARGVALFNNEYYKIKHNAVNMMGSLWNSLNEQDAKKIFSDPEKLKTLLITSSSHDESLKKYFVNRKKEIRDNIFHKISTFEYNNMNVESFFDLFRSITD